MNKEIIKKWNKYSKDLEDYFKNTKQSDYDTYEKIVKKIFEIIINQDIDYGEYDTENMLVIDDGSYQGTEIFILHKNVYQPSLEDYIYTHTYYGSCSGCDTLQAISSYSSDKPNEDQVKGYMILSLHLIQKMKVMVDNND